MQPTTDEPPSDEGFADDGGEGGPRAVLSALSQVEMQLQDAVSELLDRFDKKLAYDTFKEEQISRLHAELQEYKQDLLARAVRPLVLGIVRLHGDLDRIVTALRQQELDELTPERFFATFDGFRDDIEVLLGQHGVEPFRMPGEEFDPRRQTAVRTLPCAEQEKVGRVVERLRPGFAQGEDTLTKEKVVVAAMADGESSTAVRFEEQAPRQTGDENPQVDEPEYTTQGETE